MDDICKNIEEYNPNKKHKILIVFDANMLRNENLSPRVTELFVRVENWIFLLFLLSNLTFLYNKILD